MIYQLIKYLHDVEGLGYRKISQKLNSWGIPTHRGKEWLNTFVHSVLKRKKQREDRIEHQRLQKFDTHISEFQLKYITFD